MGVTQAVWGNDRTVFRMIRKRRFLPLTVAWLVMTVVMTGWGTVLAAEKVAFVGDWPPGGDKALPFYAMHKGLFAAEGLDVTIRSARGSSEAIESIAIGQADMGSGGGARRGRGQRLGSHATETGLRAGIRGVFFGNYADMAEQLKAGALRAPAATISSTLESMRLGAPGTAEAD